MSDKEIFAASLQDKSRHVTLPPSEVDKFQPFVPSEQVQEVIQTALDSQDGFGVWGPFTVLTDIPEMDLVAGAPDTYQMKPESHAARLAAYIATTYSASHPGLLCSTMQRTLPDSRDEHGARTRKNFDLVISFL